MTAAHLLTKITRENIIKVSNSAHNPKTSSVSVCEWVSVTSLSALRSLSFLIFKLQKYDEAEDLVENHIFRQEDDTSLDQMQII